MGADASHLFYGVRYQVTDERELKQLQIRQHPLEKAARKVGLKTYWGNFAPEGGEYYLLYVGKKLVTLGYEGSSDFELSDTKLTQLQLDVRRRLSRGGFSLKPALFGQFEPDY